MYHHPDLLLDIAAARGDDLRAAAAAHRLADREPGRTRVARSLRRAADRLDAATATYCRACDAIPERG